eukprot:CAMPEP_0116057496 /NCGR_PEP_ID=MMETSP0322-20121206/4641_1 /TAXON_ID=163516 /ORGANISM="Leptocylindrus danicus var. apora, Strain B651" /LENGTH=630 /DNA_ID=CAMNT_0003541509 /DNA_START=35 /DNA_END=1927 /DNA_ORIENTATION=+
MSRMKHHHQHGTLLTVLIICCTLWNVLASIETKPQPTNVAQPLRNAQQKIRSAIQSFQKKRDKKQGTTQDSDDYVNALTSMPIKEVTAPESMVLPRKVIELAAKRSGMIGRPLNAASVSECAKFIKQWYHRQGYVLSSVTGATLNPDGVTELKVEEPVMANQPVAIGFAKEVVIVDDDDEGQKTVTYKQFRKMEAAEIGSSRVRKPVPRSDLNTTYVQTEGRTKAKPIARTLDLYPGEPFRWQQARWKRILGAGLFSNILKCTPARTNDGKVQLQVIAAERPPRNLEYGVTKSFYTGSWEGEVEFEHQNLFGGGEVASLNVRRGAKDSYPSIRARYTDEKFGFEGGYGIEAFSEFIGETETDIDNDDVVTFEVDKSEDTSEDEINEIARDGLLGRTGLTFSLNHPFASVLDRSAGSASFERTTTRAGNHEVIASTTLEAGPFLRGYPDEARHSLKVSLTGGGRGSPKRSFEVTPFTAATIVAKEIFPLSKVDRPICLAFNHAVTASSSSLPVHEARAAGVRASVRGYNSSNGAVSSSLVGTTELRVPITLPSTRFGQDASLSLFGDWHFVDSEGGQRDTKVMNGRFARRSSVGIGIRKSIQGLPLKYDICFTEDGKLGTHFSLGRDFDVL